MTPLASVETFEYLKPLVSLGGCFLDRGETFLSGTSAWSFFQLVIKMKTGGVQELLGVLLCGFALGVLGDEGVATEAFRGHRFRA